MRPQRTSIKKMMSGGVSQSLASRSLFVMLLLAVIGSVALGDTIAYWRFDDAQDSEIVENAGGTVANGIGLPDSDGQTVWRKAAHDWSGNGNHLTTWEYAWAGHTWSNDVPATSVPAEGYGNSLSITSAGSYPAAMTWSEQSNPTGVDLETWSPSEFTIEASFKLTDISGYHTIVGRDGTEVATDRAEPALAPFYLSSRAGTGTLGVVMTDVDGYTHIVESEEGFVETDTWYNVAVVSDGTTLSLYCNNELVNSIDMIESGTSDTHLAIGETSGDGWESGTWTVTRGLYNGGHTDRVYGWVDEIRFSDVALDPVNFLFGKASPKAGDPSPVSGATDCDPMMTLTWSMGAYESTHNLYFGTSEEDLVELATGLDVSSYEVGQLELEQTYYWRVDEVNVSSDHTVTVGDVWTFTVEPVSFAFDSALITVTASTLDATSGPASATIDGNGLDDDDLHNQSSSDMWISSPADPMPWIQYDFNEILVLDKMWVWNSNTETERFLGFGVKQALIEVSVDGNEWTVVDANRILDQAAGTGRTPVTSVVDMGAVQASSVRITALSNWSSLPGITQCSLSEVRFFSIPVAARLPEPANGADDVAANQILKWRSGRYAATHDLYLSTDEEAVIDGSALVASVDESQFDLSDLDIVFNRTYYWRVDEVNGADVVAGDVWSFSTPEYILIDDMESYNDSDNYIYDSWIDGYTDSSNGSQVGHDDSPYYEESIVHGGSKSMPFNYNYTEGDDVSKATFDLGDADWSLGGIQTLTLYFLGDRDNVDGQLYLEIDGARATCETSLSLGLWKQWDVNLVSLGIDLSSVESLVIGVDADEVGLIYVDDITVHAEEVSTAVSPVDPGTEGLQLWYEMEENIEDSAGNYDGQTDAFLNYDDGLFGQALNMDGSEDYVSMPIGDLVAGLNSSTFSMWIYLNESDASWQRALDVGTGEDNYFFICPRLGTADVARVAIRSLEDDSETLLSSEADLPIEFWVNMTVVFDADAGTMELYVGGESIASVETTVFPANLGVTTNNWLGDSQFEADGLFNGMLDEVRIYNRALSEAEVRYLAGDE